MVIALPGSIPGRAVTCGIEFVVGSPPCFEGFFPGCSFSLPPQKPTFQVPSLTGNSGHRATLLMTHCQMQFIYFIIYVPLRYPYLDTGLERIHFILLSRPRN